jgi:gas vesicle protein
MRSKTFLALLTGLAAGAVLGVLFAPDKGEVSRKKVKKAVGDYIDKAKEKLSDLATNTENTEKDE